MERVIQVGISDTMLGFEFESNRFHMGFIWITFRFRIGFEWVSFRFRIGFKWVTVTHRSRIGFKMGFIWVSYHVLGRSRAMEAVVCWLI